MKIGEKMQEAINKQINAELYSGYLYLSMSAYFESENLPGFAHWMRKQWEEEVKHAMKFYKFVFERDGNVTLDMIQKPQEKWESPETVFETTYKHEQKVTALISALVDIARTENDKATESFLRWYIDEQVEEEASALEVLNQLKMIGKSGNGLIMLDRVLSKRE